MNSLETPVNYTKKESMVFTHYQVVFINMVLHKEVTLNIYLYGESGRHLHTIYYKVEGDEYIQWGDNDSYIESIVQREIQKLNTETVAESTAESPSE
jgi:hypothetical protein